MPPRNSLGVFDAETDEVPGTVLLLSDRRNEPFGIDHIRQKQTTDGIILDPQPDDHPDDPLNWASWRRDCALLTLGWHCLVGGGQTPVLAAGFNDVANTFGVSIPQVALTTGLYMLGLGIGCVIASPTALIFGKRPVYLAGVILFLVSSIWAAASQSYPSLVVARIVMGLGVAPCEALPSATIAEIFFLHERAYRIGIYTLLLLGGKNLVPLVSAAIIQTLGWRWVFWIVAMVVGFNFVLLFLFVPETFWDRTPRPKSKSDRPSFIRRCSSSIFSLRGASKPRRRSRSRSRASTERQREEQQDVTTHEIETEVVPSAAREGRTNERRAHFVEEPGADRAEQDDGAREIPTAREVYQMDHAKTSRESLDRYVRGEALRPIERTPTPESSETVTEKTEDPSADAEGHKLQGKSFAAQLKIYHGRQQKAVWWRAAIRPFVLFAYPAILWSTVVYALSIGWLIVLSESVAHIYQVQPYNFSRLATGLIYVSPFIGGCFGTVCAGKVSDIIVRVMCRRNGGVYEPEFRLVMAIPVALSTAIGLMGFGWSAQQHDSWIVPTIFFGIISFGCSMGSTTAITFAVDSYRQYASEALVTLNFSKNVLHGFVFSLFFNSWLDVDGSKAVFIALGCIQMGCLLFTIPLYIYGKRLRLWTVRRNMMEKL